MFLYKYFFHSTLIKVISFLRENETWDWVLVIFLFMSMSMAYKGYVYDRQTLGGSAISDFFVYNIQHYSI